jgi:hypothetical protein
MFHIHRHRQSQAYAASGGEAFKRLLSLGPVDPTDLSFLLVGRSLKAGLRPRSSRALLTKADQAVRPEILIHCYLLEGSGLKY